MAKKVKPTKLSQRLEKLKTPLPTQAKALGRMTETEVRARNKSEAAEARATFGDDGLVTVAIHADGEVGLIYAETVAANENDSMSSYGASSQRSSSNA